MNAKAAAAAAAARPAASSLSADDADDDLVKKVRRVTALVKWGQNANRTWYVMVCGHRARCCRWGRITSAKGATTTATRLPAPMATKTMTWQLRSARRSGSTERARILPYCTLRCSFPPPSNDNHSQRVFPPSTLSQLALPTTCYGNPPVTSPDSLGAVDCTRASRAARSRRRAPLQPRCRVTPRRAHGPRSAACPV